jgi:hypothetical protein
VLKTAAVLLLAIQISGLTYWSRNDFVPILTSKLNAADDVAQLAQIVQEAPGPVLLDEYMGLAPLAGRPIYLQPFELSQLEQAHLWDSAALIDAIQRREFSAILLYEPGFGPPMIVSRWSPEIREAIWGNYSAAASHAGTWVYLPKPQVLEENQIK